MDAKEREERQRVIDEAREWIGTPYRTAGRIKQGGCDCGTFLLGVFENAGLVEHIDLPFYPEDIACHCAVPKYLMKIEEFCNRVEDGTRYNGDILVYWFSGSKVPHHAAIKFDDDYIIHSLTRHGVIFGNIDAFEGSLYGVYRFKRWCV